MHSDGATSFSLGSGDGHSDGHAKDMKVFVFEYLRLWYRFLSCPEELMVIMTGSPESVGDVALQKAIETAVEEFDSTANILTSMPEYVAARGAVELAWRALSLKNLMTVREKSLEG